MPNGVPVLLIHQIFDRPARVLHAGKIRIRRERAPEVLERLFVPFQVKVDLPAA